MALVVEDGTGKTDAESYISETDADAYHAAHSASTTWTGASSAEKENALRLAAQYLDTMYKSDWLGSRFSDEQALDWPRNGVSIDEIAYDADDLPQQLLDAACELALKVIDGDTLFADMTDEGIVGSTTVRVGLISESTTFIGGSRGIKRYRLVEALVSVLIAVDNTLERS